MKFWEFLEQLMDEGKKLEENRVEFIAKMFDNYYKQHFITFGTNESLFSPVINAVYVLLKCSYPNSNLRQMASCLHNFCLEKTQR
jgi:malate synthase